MSLKSRNIDVDKSLCARTWFTVFGSAPINVQEIYTDIQGIEILSDSSPHKYLTGGELTIRRTTVKSKPAEVFAFTQTGGVDYFYQGKIHAKQYGVHASGLPDAIPQSTMLGEGVKGWNRFKPTSRKGSLSQAILELKDVPHMLKQAESLRNLKTYMENMLHEFGKGGIPLLNNLSHYSKDIGKQAGGHYLNAQFGLSPLLNDVRQLVTNGLNTQKRIDQLARDNGKAVRRSGTVSEVVNTTSDVLTGSFSSPSMPSPLYQTYNNELQFHTHTDSQKYWFSARFKYWIKPVAKGNLVGKFFQAEHVNRILYGTDINLNTLYQLMPWSWFLDWFSSAGDSISNWSEDANDNLVADYAYVMGYSHVSEMYVVQGVTVNGRLYMPSQEYLTEVKQRTAATPYGFYAVPPLLSAKQISILGALGLTHVPRGFG